MVLPLYTCSFSKKKGVKKHFLLLNTGYVFNTDNISLTVIVQSLPANAFSLEKPMLFGLA